MGLFTPVYQKQFLKQKELEKARKKIEAMTDQDKLFEIATKAPNVSVREMATGKLNSYDALYAAVLSEPHMFGKAFYRLAELGDEEGMANLVIQCHDDWFVFLHSSMIACFHDKSLLRKVARSARKNSFRFSLAESLEDPTLLSEIATKDADPGVRSGAIRNPHMTDCAALAKIALTDDVGINREYAIDNPHLAGALQTVAAPPCADGGPGERGAEMNASSPELSPQTRARLVMLSDALPEKVLREIFSAFPGPEFVAWAAQNAQNPSNREYAVVHLEDPQILARLALEDGDVSVRRAAVANPHMTDPCALEKAALYDPDGEVRLAAIKNEHMTETRVLAAAAESDSDAKVRRAAVANPGLTDSQVPVKLALEDADAEVRRAAAANPSLADSQVLARLASEDADGEVRRAAAANPSLTDPELLKRLATEEPDPLIRAAAIRNPSHTDQALFAKIALEPRVEFEAGKPLGGGYTSISQETRAWRNVRLAAIERLEDMDALARVAGNDSEHWELRWPAALRLSRLDPARAVEPLVRMMAATHDYYVEPRWRKEAIAFLKQQYKNAANPEGLLAIRSLPNGWYGTTRDVSCYEHSDSRVHFDLS